MFCGKGSRTLLRQVLQCGHRVAARRVAARRPRDCHSTMRAAAGGIGVQPCVCVYDKQLTSTRAHASHPCDQPQDPRHPHQPIKSEETSSHSLPHAKGAHTVDRARCQQEGVAEAAPQEPEAPTGAAPAEAAVLL